MAAAVDEVGANQRWWESYLVRYFLGFIVGCICVVILFGRANPVVTDNLKDSILPSAKSIDSGPQVPTSRPAEEKKSDILIAPLGVFLAFTGVAYCYICSTPITILHSTRMMNTWFRRYSRTFWMVWAISQAIYLSRMLSGSRVWYDVLLVLIMIVVCVRSTHLASTAIVPSGGRISGARFAKSVSIFTVITFCASLSVEHFTVLNPALFLFALPAVWILIGQYWTIIRLLEDQSETFFKFYKNISKARQREKSRDIRDSYTHLREHGNAIFVVMIELAILALLLCIVDVLDHFSASPPQKVDYYSSLLVLIGIWLAPTVFIWGLANRLENEFSEKPDEFLLP